MEFGRAAPLAGVIIVALMIEGTIPVVIDDAWLWALLALFAVALVFPHRQGRHRQRPFGPRPPGPPPGPEPD